MSIAALDWMSHFSICPPSMGKRLARDFTFINTLTVPRDVFSLHQFIRSAHMNYLYAVLKMVLKHYENSTSVFTVGFQHLSAAASGTFMQF